MSAYIGHMTEAKIHDMLRLSIAAAGSLRAWAREHGLSAPYVSDVMRGNRSFGPSICEALGIERVNGTVTYRRKSNG
jgi:DNA-binding transcriptional regulator YdaS (Cro superfamily)